MDRLMDRVVTVRFVKRADRLVATSVDAPKGPDAMDAAADLEW